MRRFPAIRLRWWHGAVAAVALLACAAVVVTLVVVLGEPDEPEPGPPEDAPRALVGLGDSTMSGDGAGSYVPGTDGEDGNWCRRSTRAAIHRTSLPGIDETINLACSGARARHVQLGDEERYGEPSQTEQLAEIAETHRIVAVVVAVGANDDPGFTRLMTQCIQAWFGGAPCSESFAPEWEDTIQAMVPKVVQALDDIRTVMADADYAEDDYQLVLQSYASPLSPDIAEEVRNLGGCPFTETDLEWVRTEGVEGLNAGLREAAAEAEARFLDLSSAGQGREACTGGQDPSTEWFTRLTVEWEALEDTDRARQAARESFHPNAAGHAQVGSCLSQFLAGDAQQAACLVGEDGNLRAAPALP
ncbi:GDSL-type esterase/lipase family protein [Haloechinothrix sp. LS1_15]|uniref:GDSL-type esterase/lipase family protein n=1 Tax=Haloechinothrix sp. LS1_15 TaxID=2652248 RepID=UPI002948892A|nr:GDSL-type esterase/lipase family protein [Haloechinothrix sp. LS1_15]MDV6014005.1 hypothetical protein [Haloechinothrix sp. LS1_15]